jgi:hypothetical protein
LFAGFRPELALLLSPLVFVPAWIRKVSWRLWLAAASCAAVTALPWLLMMVRQAGGLVWPVTEFPGAVSGGLISMGSILVGALLSALPWVALVPFARAVYKDLALEDRSTARFLALWFVPCVLLTLFPPQGPERALAAIPAMCLAGTWVLTRLPSGWFWLAAPAVLASNAGLFFCYPAFYPAVERTMHTADRVYAHAGLLKKLGPLTVLVRGASITPREIGYYLPGVPVIDLEHEPARLEKGDIEIRPGKVMWIDPMAVSDAGCFDGLREALGGELGSEGSVHWANLQAGVRFRVGRQGFVAGNPAGRPK